MNTSEEVYCVFLFMVAATIFGTLVSQINEILSASQAAGKELDLYLEPYLAIRPRLNPSMLLKIRGWERFSFKSQQEQSKSKEILKREGLPEKLRMAVAQNIENNLLSKVFFLSHLHSIENIRTLFSAELLIRSKTLYFSEGSLIANSKEKANGLMVITSGRVGVELPIDSDDADRERCRRSQSRRGSAESGVVFKQEQQMQGDGNLLHVLKHGDSFGDTAVIGDIRWAGKFGVEADFIALTHCAVEFINTEHIEAILGKFEYFPIRCRIGRAKERHRKFVEELSGRPHFWMEGNSSLKESKPSTKTVFFWTLIARGLSDELYLKEQMNAKSIDEFHNYSWVPEQKEPARGLHSQVSAVAMATKAMVSAAASSASAAAGLSRPTRKLSLLGRGAAKLSPKNTNLKTQLSAEEERHVQEAFELFDTDGDGKLDLDELAAAMIALGFDTAEAAQQRRQCREAFAANISGQKASQDASLLKLAAAVDTDGSNTIDINEFRSLMQGALTCRDSADEILFTYQRLMEMNPTKAANGVTAGMVREACTRLKMLLDEDEINNMITEADRDGDGEVSEEEYSHILKMSCWF